MKEKESSRKSEPKAQPHINTEPTRSEDGVDVTLIRWMLSLTAAERLHVLQQNIRSISRLRHDATDI